MTGKERVSWDVTQCTSKWRQLVPLLPDYTSSRPIRQFSLQLNQVLEIISLLNARSYSVNILKLSELLLFVFLN